MSASTPLMLLGTRWERIQLVFRFAGEQPPLAFIHEEETSARMPATRQWVEGGETFARFNVMQGPERVPLGAGHWRLGLRDGTSTKPLKVTAEPGAELPERVFKLKVRRLRVAPVMDTAGVLRLEVELGFEPDAVDDGARSDGYDDDAGTREGLAAAVGRRARKEQKKVRRRLSRIVVSVFRVTRRSKRGRVLFITRLSPVLTGNLKTVHDRMLERGLDRDFDLVRILKKEIKQSLGWRGRLHLLWSLGRADVIFLDDSFAPVYWFDFPPEVRVVQLWHASGAFKTVGYSRAGQADEESQQFLNPYGRIHKNYTHVTVSSEHDVPFYAEALGVPEDRVFPTGIPRMDRFFRPEYRAIAEREAREQFPFIEGRTVWLFAPTYRADTVADAYYDEELIDWAALHAVAVEKNAVVIFKNHPFVRKDLAIPEAYKDRFVDATRTRMDVNDLLFVVDLLITDYSSIIFEYSVLKRPMLFFAYDLEEYLASRDLYVPFEELVPGRIVRTFPDLVDALRREDYEASRMERFAEEHFAYLDAGATDRVIDLVLPR